MLHNHFFLYQSLASENIDHARIVLIKFASVSLLLFALESNFKDLAIARYVTGIDSLLEFIFI